MTTTTQNPEIVMDHAVVLGLGSNLGASEEILRRAIGELRRFIGPLDVAPLYRSAPVSPIAQPDFLNTVALAREPADVPEPGEALAFVKALEHAAGRRPGPRFGPRPLDVDLLLWGSHVCDTPDLTLPHPRLAERRFVLAPLADLRPDLRLPPRGETAGEILARLGGGQEAERVGWSPAAARYTMTDK